MSERNQCPKMVGGCLSSVKYRPELVFPQRGMHQTVLGITFNVPVYFVSCVAR